MDFDPDVRKAMFIIELRKAIDAISATPDHLVGKISYQEYVDYEPPKEEGGKFEHTCWRCVLEIPTR